MSINGTDTICKNKCTPDHPSGICQGCGRTNKQVYEWNGYPKDEQEQIRLDIERKINK